MSAPSWVGSRLLPIGRGGGGRVFRVDSPSGQPPLALKLITSAAGAADPLRRRVAAEAAAVAALLHPHVVVVHDHGFLDQALSLDAESIPAGTPWLLMELLSGGSLGDRLGRLDWVDIHPILVALLGALGHAHSRGVIHRDVKPSNVLFGGGEGPLSGRPGCDRSLRLADFGLAAVAGPGQGADPLATGGTPAYMAPEQVRGAWRDIGPATDLYALGGLAWALLCGAPPFHAAGSVEALWSAQLCWPLPPFAPRCPVPAGVEDWTRWLLTRDLAGRCPHTAQALSALPRMEEPLALQTLRSPLVEATDGPTRTLGLPASEPRWAPSEPAGSPRRPPPRSVLLAPFPSPPPARPPMAGLGLLRLRRLPLLGREEEQQQLWTALSEVIRSGKPGLVILQGAAGTGKSCLARWLGEAAAEVGAAELLQTTAGGGGPWDGLRGLVLRVLRLEGLPHEEAAARIRATLLAQLSQRVVHLLAAVAAEPAAGRLRAVDRVGAVAQWVQSRATVQPQILWLDDVHADEELIALAERLQASADGPLLVVLTVVEELLAEHPARVQRLSRLGASPAATTLPIPALGIPELQCLLRDVLYVEPEAARRLARRVGGSPLFALHLLLHWEQEGRLRLEQARILPPDTESELLPPDLFALWSLRVSWLLERAGQEDPRPIELAALLGPRVDALEWARAASEAGLCIPERLVEALVDSRLWSPIGGGASGWDWAHGMLREAVLCRSVEEGHAPSLHRAAAVALLVEPGRRSAARRAAHLLAAGEPVAALEPLREAAEVAWVEDRLADGQELLDRWLAVAASLQLPRSDPRRGAWLWACARQGQKALPQAEAIVKLDELMEAATQGGLSLALGLLCAARAWLAWRAGDRAGSMAWLERARAQEMALGDPRLSLVYADYGSRILDRLGQLSAAIPLRQRMLDEARRLSDVEAEARAHGGLASLKLQAGDLDGAALCADAALTLGGELQGPTALVDGLEVLAAVARLRGDRGRARVELHRAQEVLASVHPDAKAVSYARISLVELDLEEGLYPGVSSQLDQIEADWLVAGRRDYPGLLPLLRAWAAAGLGDRAAAGLLLSEAAGVGIPPGAARAARLLASLAEEGGWSDLAILARSLAAPVPASG